MAALLRTRAGVRRIFAALGAELASEEEEALAVHETLSAARDGARARRRALEGFRDGLDRSLRKLRGLPSGKTITFDLGPTGDAWDRMRVREEGGIARLGGAASGPRSSAGGGGSPNTSPTRRDGADLLTMQNLTWFLLWTAAMDGGACPRPERHEGVPPQPGNGAALPASLADRDRAAAAAAIPEVPSIPEVRESSGGHSYGVAGSSSCSGGSSSYDSSSSTSYSSDGSSSSC